MVAKNINSTRMKMNNEKLVLDTIRKFGSISRKDLAKRIGLTSSTITNIVNKLLQEKYVNETGIDKSLGGRRPILLSINPQKFYFVGVELKANEISSVITDFKANILFERHTRINFQMDSDTIINIIVNDIETIISEIGVDRTNIEGVGISTPGPCDIEKGTVINPPNLNGWKNIPIKSIIEERTGLSVVFEKSTSMAALSEFWFGRAHQSKCLFLCGVYEVGIGSSFLIDGKVFHGFANGAGEIGHMMIDMNGPQCGCGSFGCLESMADGRALVDSVKKKLKTGEYSYDLDGIEDIEAITFKDVLNRAEKGEEPFLAMVKDCSKYIGIAINNIIVSISPDTIVLTGDLPDNSSVLVEEIEKHIHNCVYPLDHKKIRVYCSEHKRIAGALGGVAKLFQGIFKNS